MRYKSSVAIPDFLPMGPQSVSFNPRSMAIQSLKVSAYLRNNRMCIVIQLGVLSAVLILECSSHQTGIAVTQCYKSEGRWFDPSWYQWIFH